MNDHEKFQAFQKGFYDATGGDSEFTFQMWNKLITCELPNKDSNFEDYLLMIKYIIEILPQVRSIDEAIYQDLKRRIDDVVEEAHSIGLERITASDICKTILRLRALLGLRSQKGVEERSI